jgi:hypothetical protein
MQTVAVMPDKKEFEPGQVSEKPRVWDKYGATFRHEIYLTGRNPSDPMHGYGKKEAFTEKQDRLAVLTGIIQRIWFDNDYRRRADRMDFFVQTSPIRRDHPKILTLYPAQFTPYGELLQCEGFIKGLNRMYRPDTTIAGGFKNLSDVFNPEKVAELEADLRHKELSEQQRFHPELAKNPLAAIPVFEDNMALVNYCMYLSKNGIRPVGAVNAWYMHMVAQFPNQYGK